jgi:hypothetical protein
MICDTCGDVTSPVHFRLQRSFCNSILPSGQSAPVTCEVCTHHGHAATSEHLLSAANLHVALTVSKTQIYGRRHYRWTGPGKSQRQPHGIFTPSLNNFQLMDRLEDGTRNPNHVLDTCSFTLRFRDRIWTSVRPSKLQCRYYPAALKLGILIGEIDTVVVRIYTYVCGSTQASARLPLRNVATML